MVLRSAHLPSTGLDEHPQSVRSLWQNTIVRMCLCHLENPETGVGKAGFSWVLSFSLQRTAFPQCPCTAKSIPVAAHLQSSFLTGPSPAGLPLTLMASVSAGHLLRGSVPTRSHIFRYKRSVFQTELWERITTQPMTIPHLTLEFLGFQATLLCGVYICTCYHGECFLSPSYRGWR